MMTRKNIDSLNKKECKNRQPRDSMSGEFAKRADKSAREEPALQVNFAKDAARAFLVITSCFACNAINLQLRKD